MSNAITAALRGAVVTFSGDPFHDGAEAMTHIEDGLILVSGQRIAEVGDYMRLYPRIPTGVKVADHRGRLILPGFIDAHVHYPQTGVIASYGTQLLTWLDKYTFPEETRFADPAYAHAIAELFLDELAVNGTTTAAVFCTSAPNSVDAFFNAAQARNVRMIAGKVLMDRNAPDELLDTPERAHDESLALISKWHGRGRLAYALTPRFAITSTPEQLEACGALAKAHPEVYIQSHISENKDEIEETMRLYPERRSYADIYAHYGLLRDRALYAHGLHLSEAEWQLFHESGAAVVHCPTSNAFLGSGHFDLAAAKRADRPVRVALGTDVGGGTSFSILRTLGASYNTLQMLGQSLPPSRAFYQATLGSAKSMGLAGTVGAIEAGWEADFTILDPSGTSLLAHRTARADSIDDVLFALMVLGDDRAVASTWSGGREIHRRAIAV